MSTSLPSRPLRSEKVPERSPSPLWTRALERYRQELQEPEDYLNISKVHSLDDLLQDVSALRPPLRDRNALLSLNRLGPKLKFVDDFSAAIALCFGANTTLTALVWGSIRLILQLASSAEDTLQDVLNMIEDLSLKLPRFRLYENTLPMNRGLEHALVDVYTEVICFYARTILFFRNPRHILLQKAAWDDFNVDFSRTIQRIKRMSFNVETEADSARMKMEEDKYKEVLELLNTRTKTSQDITRFHHLPPLNTTHSYHRNALLEIMNRRLEHDTVSSKLQTFALFGMGGVGKTQLALQYAHQNSNKYDVILWISADNSITSAQSFRDIAIGLNLIGESSEEKDTNAAIVKVKSWLVATNASWLLIFDNADDLHTLRFAWPGTSRGSALITTRDYDVAAAFAVHSVQLQPLNEDDGTEYLLRLVEKEHDDETNRDHARLLSRTLGGLPLALSQIGAFINQRKISLSDFLPLYEKHTARIDAKRPAGSEYEHTLSTVWDVSFSKLPKQATTLLNLLAFFDPDGIHEQVFIDGSEEVALTEEFSFLGDEMDFGDAEEPLLQYSLINKGITNRVVSLHRLVQATTMGRLSEAEKALLFETTVKLLSWGFPDTWSKDVGHQIAAWKKCEMCLPHIGHLVKQKQKYKLQPRDVQSYAELLLRCSWYLYEREMYDLARDFVDAALETFSDRTTLAYASAVDLSGLIDLDLMKTVKALNAFETALQIRKAILNADDPLVAFSLNNIALAYTEMGELDQAYKVHQDAIDIRLRTKSDRIGNSYSNMASLLLRMRQPDEAEEMLKRCPSLQDFTDDTFLRTGNPRFSGDMVLLSRIRRSQERTDDAMRLASKALAFRQQLLGNRLKTCDSLYDVASLLHEQGNAPSAIKLLLELVTIAETLREGEGQLARALYKLAILHEERGLHSESETFKTRALDIRARLRPEAEDSTFSENEFMQLCLWMLW